MRASICVLALVPAAQAFVPLAPAPRRAAPSRLHSAADALAVSALVAGVAPSKTIEVHAATQELIAAGEEVISLCVGEPDFDAPAAALQGGAAALEDGATRYTAVSGEAALREAICADLKRRRGTEYAPDEVLVCNGAKQAVYQAILAHCGPGDEVILPAPYWPSYPEMVKLAGATPVFAECSVDDGYCLTPAALRAALSPKTRMLIFCNPSNPTGAVLDDAACRGIADVLDEPAHRGVAVLADEIYERIAYGDAPVPSFAALEGMRERTLVVNGFSKCFAMTGFRLGYMAGPRAAIKASATIQGQITSCASSVSQRAGLAALQGTPDAWVDDAVAAMRLKRDYVVGALGRMPGVKCATPMGAFYVLPDVSAYFGKTAPDGTGVTDATALCLALLRLKKIAIVTGDGFGAPSAVRISYATDMATLEAAMAGLADFLGELE